MAIKVSNTTVIDDSRNLVNVNANGSNVNASGTWNISVTGTSSNVTGIVGVANGGTGASSLTGLVKGNGTGAMTAATANSDYVAPAMANTPLSGIRTATFNSQAALASTSGTININWSNAQNQRQPEPTGAITYTFTAPPGPCHLQLLIDSDGTSTAQTITWPGTVIQYGTAWGMVNNKRSIVNFWYDGTNYHMVGSNQI